MEPLPASGTITGDARNPIPDALSVKRAFLILNPAAGRGRGARLAKPLADVARAMGWDVVVRLTKRAGEEVDLAVEAREDGWPIVIAVGGDGTVHGTANGLLADGPTAVTLGHVPVGTGNDYARSLGIGRHRPAEILRQVLSGTRRLFDVGRVDGEYFVNDMGAGFDAEVVRQTLRMDYLTGFPLYVAAVVRTFGSFVPPEIQIESAEHTETAWCMMCNVSIGVRQGGGFRLAPDAVPDDGLLDVCLIRRVGLRKFVRYLPRVVRGTHGNIPEVAMFRTTSVRITGVSGPLPVQLDGELRYPDHEELEVTILPKHLHVLCVAPS
jgi:YegS/Rv2252/BmrU family lipid kinase